MTTGTLSNPRVDDDNSGRQVSGRLGVTPVVGLVLGLSAARGEWIADDPGLGGRGHDQTAVGLDGEYSRDRWILRGEAIRSRWAVPFSDAVSGRRRLSAWTGWLEGRYRLTPRLFAAARADRLRFSTLQDAGGPALPWDAPVDRLELTAGWYLQRNVLLRAGLQANWREPAQRQTFFVSQIGWWF